MDLALARPGQSQLKIVTNKGVFRFLWPALSTSTLSPYRDFIPDAKR